MFSHETPTFQHSEQIRRKCREKREQGQGLGALPISSWSLKMEGSGFPLMCSGGGSEGEGLDVAVPAWGGGPE